MKHAVLRAGNGAGRRVVNSEVLSARPLSGLALATPTTTSRSWTCARCSGSSGNHSNNRLIPRTFIRASSSSSQWKQRQKGDKYVTAANVAGWKSRAAFKLLELNDQYKLFRPSQTVVDLGYAPGSWSQVAIDRVGPQGVVVGIDLIPAQPPRGVTGIQGNFLSPQVRRLFKDVLVEQVRRKRKERAMKKEAKAKAKAAAAAAAAAATATDADTAVKGSTAADEDESEVVLIDRPSYIDQEKQASHDIELAEAEAEESGRFVDVVLSDMCDPWPQETGFRNNTLSRPYRLMNTSGIALRDHVLSIDLCHAALSFASENLKAGGHFVCKFYQGGDDALFQKKLMKMFTTVKREKPDSSRRDSREAFFVALDRKGNVTLADVEARLSDRG
ncbi:FtsJ-like methyltransferase-domain-containing protein [Coniella lustricola]|uniref:rRNA methyltransferase 2, mitochondrial n=1 Tax=Coniella lustricola TaxID=2025994 RepID=A0A2T3AHF5_9PEZI|nr:FtsJ-like methyltransferase-domain-containing protein [Coniella lustricola]